MKSRFFFTLLLITICLRSAGQDLIVYSGAIVTNTLSSSDLFDIRFRIQNNGGALAAASYAGIKISQSNNGSGLIDLGFTSVEKLTPGQISNQVEYILPLPYSITSGTYYVYVVADNSGGVAESNESNNQMILSGTIAVTRDGNKTRSNIPYPILFIHDWLGDDGSWREFTDSVLNKQYGWTDGGVLDYCLNFDNNTATSELVPDFHDYVGAHPYKKGDYYRINFDIDANGNWAGYVGDTNDVSQSNQSAVRKQGYAIQDAISYILTLTGRDKVILVGHGMGGLAAREYLQRWTQTDGKTHVAKLVVSATPNRGTNSTQFGIGVGGFDQKSEAARDVKTSYAVSGKAGVYLFGGYESPDSIKNSTLYVYNNVDVNCSGTINQTVLGLDYSNAQDVNYSCIIGTGDACPQGGGAITSDGVVDSLSADLYNGFSGLNKPYYIDTFKVTPRDNYDCVSGTGSKKFLHTDINKSLYGDVNIAALDEPDFYDDPGYGHAYGISLNQLYYGIIASKSKGAYYGSATDYDDYKVELPNQSNVQINIFNITIPKMTVAVYSSIDLVTPYYIDTSVGKGNMILPISNVPAGTYYVEVSGSPVADLSWKRAYGFQVMGSITTAPSQPGVISGVTNPCEASSQTYSVSPVFGATTYTWILPSGWSGVSSSNTITATIGSTSGNVCVTADNSYGASTQRCTAITVKPSKATITAGGSTTFCQGGSVVLSSSSATNYLWSNSATTKNITVTSSGSYSVFVTNSNGCSATSAATVVTVNPLPVATITPSGNTTFCQGNSVILSASSASTYQWSTGATTQSITASSSGTYSVTVTNSNNCSATSSVTTVTVNPLPVATVTPAGATTFCQGNSVVLNSSPGISYSWSNGATTSGITVLSSGTYTVTVTNANNCSAVSAGTVVTVNPLPVVTIITGGNTTFCQGNSVVLNSSSGSFYQWSTGATAQSITVSSSGSYSVTVMNANNCTATSAATVVTVNPLPVAAITPNGNTTFCQGDSVVLNATPAGNYLWSNGETAQSIAVSSSGTFSVLVTDANNCSATSGTTTVTVNSLPLATITPNSSTTFCMGDSVILNATPASAYQWSNGETTQGITVSSSGTYSVEVTNANNCSATSAISTVTVNSLPVVSVTAGSDTIFCEGDSVILSSSPATGYLWSGGETSQSVTVKSSGNYWVVASDANNCSATSATTTVTVKPSSAIITPIGYTIFCQGDSVILEASSANDYLWSDGETTQSITVSTAGTFSVAVTNANNCSATSAVTTVTVISTPTASIIPAGDTIFCMGDSVVLNANPANMYDWSNGETTQSITVFSSGTYSVMVTYSSNCSALSDTMTTTVDPVPVAAITPGGNTAFCEGDSVILNADSADFYLWSDGETSQGITVSSSGTYSVTTTNLNNCSATSGIETVTVYPATFLTTSSGNTTFCDGDSVILDAGSSSSYLWSNGETTQLITVLSSGTYSVMTTNAINCTASSNTVTVTANSLPVVTITPNGNTTFCQGNSVILDASTASSYQWSDGETTQSITVSSSGTYSVTATNANNCSATSGVISVTVNSLPTATIAPLGSLTFCQGGLAILSASPANKYLWSSGETTQSILVNSSGTYSVEVTNSSNCSALSSSVTIMVNPNPIASIILNGTDLTTTCTTTGCNYKWYESLNLVCSNSPSCTVNGDNMYSVVITDANGCSDSTSFLITGQIEKYLSESISVYPNPTTGRITVSISRATTHASLIIFNSLGQSVYSDEITGIENYSKEINLQEVAGIYFVVMKEGEKVYSQKLVIQ